MLFMIVQGQEFALAMKILSFASFSFYVHNIIHDACIMYPAVVMTLSKLKLQLQ